MGIFNFFKKRSKNNVSETTIKSECHNKQEKEVPELHVAEKLQASTPKYKTAEDVIAILQDNGFKIKYINTYGEGSAHDCTDSFSNQYYSIEEFTQKVHDDFNEHKERIKGAATLTWSCTLFKLIQEEMKFKAVISMGEDDGKPEPREAYLFIKKQNIDTADEEFIAKVLLMLQPFLVPKKD